MQIQEQRHIENLEAKIAYVFQDKSLLLQALSHSSYTNEQIEPTDSYERLEFLGDAVLGLVSGEYLMDSFPQMSEGELSKARAQIICEAALAKQALALELGQFILLGKGEVASGGRERASILADVMESLIGALYYDGGLEAAQSFIHHFVLTNSEGANKYFDSKSHIYEYVAKNTLGRLHYELCGVSGPEHSKSFRVALYLENDKIGEGVGKSKKAAEQQAAYKALLEMNIDRDENRPCT
jgi:ribonuclease-3